MAGIANVTLTPIRQGDPRTITITVEDGDGDPVDLSAASWLSTVRESPTSAAGVDLAIDASQGATGVLRLALTGAQSRTLSPGPVVGDVEGSTFGTILTFKADVNADVTRGASEPTGGLVDNITIVWDGTGSTLSATVLAVLANTDDQTATEVPFTPVGSLAATDVQAAIAEENTERQAADTALAADISTEQTARANADTALDGRLDTAETTLAGLGTAATANTGTGAGNVPVLDGNAKLLASILPAVALTSVNVAADIAARDALGPVEEGDVAIVLDASADPEVGSGGATYVLDGLDVWQRIRHPNDVVTSVAGLTGIISAAQLRAAINVEDGATADQTNAEIETAYNAQVAAASQAEAEAGTEAAVRRFSPLRIAQAIAAQSGAYRPPAVGAGVWAAMPGGQIANFAFGDNDARIAPFLLPAGVIDRLGCHIATGGGAGAKVRVVAWADDNDGEPGTMVGDTGQIAANTSGAKNGTVNFTHPGGILWVAAFNQDSSGSPAAITYLAANGAVGGFPLYATSQQTTSNVTSAWAATIAGVPGDNPAGDWSQINPPRVSVRFA